MLTIPEDKREIQAIWLDDQNGWSVGRASPSGFTALCTRIVAYEELGQMACVPWFAVYDGDVLVVRVPAHRCQVVRYKR